MSPAAADTAFKHYDLFLLILHFLFSCNTVAHILEDHKFTLVLPLLLLLLFLLTTIPRWHCLFRLTWARTDWYGWEHLVHLAMTFLTFSLKSKLSETLQESLLHKAQYVLLVNLCGIKPLKMVLLWWALCCAIITQPLRV